MSSNIRKELQVTSYKNIILYITVAEKQVIFSARFAYNTKQMHMYMVQVELTT